LRRVKAVVDPIVVNHGGSDAGVAADCTGVLPLINAIQKTRRGRPGGRHVGGGPRAGPAGKWFRRR
jgi:hypothetical protein